MGQAKTPLQLFVEIAEKKDTTFYFINDIGSREIYPETFYLFESQTKVLTIITGNVPKEYEEEIFKIIRDRYNEIGIILKRSNVREISIYEDYKRNNPDRDVIDFFTDKIPPEDMAALRMSLFMRNQKGNGMEIHKYKKAIRERYGERGTSIANLCNEGYFENEFMSMFNNMSLEDFEYKYELFVGKRARALFINSGMTEGYIYTSFLNMIRKCQKFALQSFRIHAFGKYNVQSIKAVLEDVKNSKDAEFTEVHNETENPHGITYDIFIK